MAEVYGDGGAEGGGRDAGTTHGVAILQRREGLVHEAVVLFEYGEGGAQSPRESNKDRELSEAQADIKALRLSERLREKAVDEIGRQSSTSQMTMLRQGVHPGDTRKSTVSAVPESSAMPFKEQQLKQLRAQCLVFLAFSKGLAPKILHLEIALGTTFSREGD